MRTNISNGLLQNISEMSLSPTQHISCLSLVLARTNKNFSYGCLWCIISSPIQNLSLIRVTILLDNNIVKSSKNMISRLIYHNNIMSLNSLIKKEMFYKCIDTTYIIWLDLKENLIFMPKNNWMIFLLLKLNICIYIYIVKLSNFKVNHVIYPVFKSENRTLSNPVA